MKWLRWAIVCAAAVAACGDDDGGGGGGNGADAGTAIDGLEAIRVEPPDAVLVIDGSTPAMKLYAAVGVFEDGSEREITDQVAFVLDDPTLGTFSGPMFASQTIKGGATVVRARAGSIEGATSLTLQLRQRYPDPGATDLPSDPEAPFSGPDDPGRAPELVYPNDGVLVPPNLRKLEIHFYPGNGNELFEISFSNGVTDVKVYTRCTQPLNGGCIYLPDASVWTWIAESNRGGSPVAVSVRGTDDGGTGVGSSDSLDVSFSYDDIRGGIYYWTTSDGTGIMRFDFAALDQDAAEKFVGTDLTDGTCVGCHALSRDGKKLVAEAGGQNDGRLLLLDVATKTPIVAFGSTPKSVFESWNPDGTQYVGVYADDGATDYNLLLFDGNTGASLGNIDIGATSADPADHPDWSPDGSRIVYSRMGIKGTNQRMFKGSIEMVTDMGGTWSAPELLVAEESGQNHYYPAFSPDGDYIVFNESQCPSGEQHGQCDADMDPTARLWMMRAESGETPVELSAANTPGAEDDGATDLTNSFPKWSPFVFQRTDEQGSRLEWLTFSSVRQYGLRSPPSGGGTLIWMTAIDPDQVDAGNDPSYPAFALPFQDLDTSNHIAQWTTEIVDIE